MYYIALDNEFYDGYMSVLNKIMILWALFYIYVDIQGFNKPTANRLYINWGIYVVNLAQVYELRKPLYHEVVFSFTWYSIRLLN